MIVGQCANSRNDEYYTPMYAIEPILKYIKPKSVIWCPFDTKDSLYVQRFRKEGHTVIATHINTGTDFFECEVPECDYIVSNPPYSCKEMVFQRLFDICKPFAMLVGVVGLFDSKTKMKLFKEHTFEVMYINPRVQFFKDYSNQGKMANPPYQSVYLCSKMLPKQIIFEEINKKKVLN